MPAVLVCVHVFFYTLIVPVAEVLRLVVRSCVLLLTIFYNAGNLLKLEMHINEYLGVRNCWCEVLRVVADETLFEKSIS